MGRRKAKRRAQNAYNQGVLDAQRAAKAARAQAKAANAAIAEQAETQASTATVTPGTLTPAQEAVNATQRPMDQLPAYSPQDPSAVNGGGYNPFTSAFKQFRMAPFLAGMRTNKAGRPSLVRGRN